MGLQNALTCKRGVKNRRRSQKIPSSFIFTKKTDSLDWLQ
jgi:hypothetical protein